MDAQQCRHAPSGLPTANAGSGRAARDPLGQCAIVNETVMRQISSAPEIRLRKAISIDPD
jgi:hypothetical protein